MSYENEEEEENESSNSSPIEKKAINKNQNISDEEDSKSSKENEDINDSLSNQDGSVEDSSSNKNISLNEEGDDIPEEVLLKNQLEEVDFQSLLKAKAKLSYDESKKTQLKNKKNEINKNKIKTKIEEINKEKSKNEPKEYSALIKPKYQFKNRKAQINNNLLQKKFMRDPRFDDMSGTLNEDQFKKNYNFVNEMANNYIKDLQKIKKNKKFKKKLSDQQYELLKKQNNYVKNWINQQKQNQIKSDIKKEINKENKERYSKGQKPIYINNNKLNKYIKQKNKEE